MYIYRIQIHRVIWVNVPTLFLSTYFTQIYIYGFHIYIHAYTNFSSSMLRFLYSLNCISSSTHGPNFYHSSDKVYFFGPRFSRIRSYTIMLFYQMISLVGKMAGTQVRQGIPSKGILRVAKFPRASKSRRVLQNADLQEEKPRR